MTLKIQKARKSLVKVRVLATGVSGSGKSLSMLYLAKGLLEEGKKLVVIDTEHGSINEYEGLMPFEVIPLEPPYSPERYIEAINLAVRETPDLGVLMVDCISREWKYIEEAKDTHVFDNPGGDKWSAWTLFKPRHYTFMRTLLHVPCHVIATAMSKTEIIIGEKRTIKANGETILMKETGLDFNPEFEFIGGSNHFLVKSRAGEFDGSTFHPLDWNSVGDVMNEQHGLLLKDHLHAHTNGVMSRTAMKDALATVHGVKVLWKNWDVPQGVEIPEDLSDEQYAEFYKFCTQEQAE